MPLRLPAWLLKIIPHDAVMRFLVWLRTLIVRLCCITTVYLTSHQKGAFFAQLKFVNLEVFDDRSRSRRRTLKQVMADATDYTTWEEAARELDSLEGTCRLSIPPLPGLMCSR